MKTVINLFFVLVLFLSSCTKDPESLIAPILEENQSFTEETNLSEINLRNGRMYFPNKTTFQTYFNENKNKDQTDVANVLEKEFYSKDFFSLKPILNERTEKEQLDRHMNKIRSNQKGLQFRNGMSQTDILEDFDDLEDIFGEDVFASFLNQDAEIQVADKIYKYTDTGLFISDENDIDSLNNFLDKNNISKNLFIPTDPLLSSQFKMLYNPCGGIEDLGIFDLFIAEDPSCYGGGGGYSGGSNTGTTPTTSGTSSDQLALIANTLAECSGSEPWFGNLFGTVKVCKDKYESKKRVKIKYYDLDLYLAYVVGIKVKHQKKGWTGFWRKQNTDEVALGINSLTWRFNHPTPPNWMSSNNSTRVYLHNGKMFQSLTGYYNAVYAGDVPMPNLPFADKVDFIVEMAIDIPFIGFDNELEVREFFYEQMFDQAKNILESNSNRQLRKAGVVITTNTETWVQLYDFSKSCTNCSKKENIIDFGIATPQVVYEFGVGSNAVVDQDTGDITTAGTSGFSLGNMDFDFRVPDVVGISAYGMAKRNGQWHGRRMVF